MASTASDERSLSILVADDEQAIRTLLVHWLERAGHRVTAAETGAVAVLLLEGQRFDLLITDVVMPEGDGLELIGAFRKAQPSAHILAISGGGRYLPREDCLKIARSLGAHAVVMKPFNWGQLQAGIDLAIPPLHSPTN